MRQTDIQQHSQREKGLPKNRYTLPYIVLNPHGFLFCLMNLYGQKASQEEHSANLSV